MKRNIPWLTIFLFALLVFLPTGSVHADVGPKPTSTFNLVWNIPRVSITKATFFTCDDEKCLNPQRSGAPFVCSEESCIYNYAGDGFYKIEIAFADKTRASEVFEKRGFSANFDLTVNENDLDVEQTSSSSGDLLLLFAAGFIFAAPITLIIELPLANFILKRWNVLGKWRIILFANLISLPIVWFVFPIIISNVWLAIGLAELFAWLFEAGFYFMFLRKDGFSIKRALLLSLYANLASISLPLLCWLIYTLFIFAVAWFI